MFESNLKIGRLSYKIYWTIFWCIQVSVIALMIGTLGAKEWGYTKNLLFGINPTTSNIGSILFNGYSFTGSFSSCTNGCSGNYGQLAMDWCNYYNNYSGKTAESICILFLTLYYGSVIFGILEVLAMICIIVWGLVMLCFWRPNKCFHLTFCCSVCACISHYLGFIIWMGITASNFNSNCGNSPVNGSQFNVCATQGPSLGLFVTIILPIIVAFYFIVACKALGLRSVYGNGVPVPSSTLGNFNNPPQYNLVHPPQYNSAYPPQYNPAYPPPNNLAYPPQFNPEYPAQFNPQYPPPLHPPPQAIPYANPEPLKINPSPSEAKNISYS
jgi:hypothetical protein